MLDNEFQKAEKPLSEAVIIGFQTAQGSMYRYNADSRTSERFKVSCGSGQGEIDPESICAFLTDAQEDYIQNNFHYKNNEWTYNLGWSKGRETGIFQGNEVDMPDDAKMALYIYLSLIHI